MTRAHFFKRIVDDAGNLQTTATVRILDPGSDPTLNSLIAATLYSGPTGSGFIANPIAVTDGTISFFLDTPQFVQVGVLIGLGGTEKFYDYTPVSGLGDSTANLHVGPGTHSTQVGDTAAANGVNGASLGYNARADQNNGTALGANSHAAGIAATAVGQQADSEFDRSVALGYQAAPTAADMGAVTVQELRLQSLSGTPDTYLTLTDPTGVKWRIGVDATGHLTTTVTT